MKLNIRALDNFGADHVVNLENGRNGVVLKIQDTPGQWYLSSLLEGVMEGYDKGYDMGDMGYIEIDLGREWRCINFDDVLREAINSVCMLKVN